MIQVINAGFYTSIQDRGRKGYRHLGIPMSGPMDLHAFNWANTLLPSLTNECVIECTMIGPHLILEKAVCFVITGALIEAYLNEKPVVMNKVYRAEAGSNLRLGKIYKGLRSYLRLHADIKTEEVLGSQSYFHPLTLTNQLKKGDEIPYSVEELQPNATFAHVKTDSSYLEINHLELFPGPDWSLLSIEFQNKLLRESHQILAQNRMGYQLSSSIRWEAPRLLSQVVIPGMLQLTPSGKIIVATADCQVTGGYLQILQLTSKSLDVLVQKREGTWLTFQNKPLRKAP